MRMISEKHKTVASAVLIILGYELDPDVVTQALDLVPSQAWRKGENKKYTRADGTIGSFDSIHEWGGWKLWLSGEPRERPLESQIDYWLQILSEHSVDIKNLKAQEAKVIIDCFLATESFFLKISSELQSQLGDLGVDLELSISNWHGPSARERRRMLRRRFRGR